MSILIWFYNLWKFIILNNKNTEFLRVIMISIKSLEIRLVFYENWIRKYFNKKESYLSPEFAA